MKIKNIMNVKIMYREYKEYMSNLDNK